MQMNSRRPRWAADPEVLLAVELLGVPILRYGLGVGDEVEALGALGEGDGAGADVGGVAAGMFCTVRDAMVRLPRRSSMLSLSIVAHVRCLNMNA